MEAMRYPSYEAYREETNRRMPETIEAHQKELAGKLAALYQQKDYRALETIMELVDVLAGDSNPERATAIYWNVRDMMQATNTELEICRGLLRAQAERRGATPSRRKPARRRSPATVTKEGKA